MEVEFKSNRQEVMQEFEAAVARALERCGSQAEGYAKDLCPVAKKNGGELRGSISHKVDVRQQKAYIGTNVKYAPYVELGTGIHYPGGRKDPWKYKDSEGNWYVTRGQKPQPYLKPAVADHAQTYRNIINDEMRDK